MSKKNKQLSHITSEGRNAYNQLIKLNSMIESYNSRHDFFLAKLIIVPFELFYSFMKDSFKQSYKRTYGCDFVGL